MNNIPLDTLAEQQLATQKSKQEGTCDPATTPGPSVSTPQHQLLIVLGQVNQEAQTGSSCCPAVEQASCCESAA